MNIRVSIRVHSRNAATALTNRLSQMGWEPNDAHADADQVIVVMDKTAPEKLEEFGRDLAKATITLESLQPAKPF